VAGARAWGKGIGFCRRRRLLLIYEMGGASGARVGASSEARAEIGRGLLSGA
jgi:hypothetical protein